MTASGVAIALAALAASRTCHPFHHRPETKNGGQAGKQLPLWVAAAKTITRSEASHDAKVKEYGRNVTSVVNGATAEELQAAQPAFLLLTQPSRPVTLTSKAG
jgi:hypothetical protein